MSIPYKQMSLQELLSEEKRLKYILQNHPKPFTYKQAKASLNTVRKYMANYVAKTLEIQR